MLYLTPHLLIRYNRYLRSFVGDIESQCYTVFIVLLWSIEQIFENICFTFQETNLVQFSKVKNKRTQKPYQAYNSLYFL